MGALSAVQGVGFRPFQGGGKALSPESIISIANRSPQAIACNRRRRHGHDDER
jgi:hypothetical protein